MARWWLSRDREKYINISKARPKKSIHFGIFLFDTGHTTTVTCCYYHWLAVGGLPVKLTGKPIQVDLRVKCVKVPVKTARKKKVVR